MGVKPNSTTCPTTHIEQNIANSEREHIDYPHPGWMASASRVLLCRSLSAIRRRRCRRGPRRRSRRPTGTTLSKPIERTTLANTSGDGRLKSSCRAPISARCTDHRDVPRAAPGHRRCRRGPNRVRRGTGQASKSGGDQQIQAKHGVVKVDAAAVRTRRTPAGCLSEDRQDLGQAQFCGFMAGACSLVVVNVVAPPLHRGRGDANPGRRFS